MRYVLKSKMRNPPQGWLFRQAETNWTNPLPMATTFEKTVKAIVAMRLNNPRHKLETDPLKVADELEQYTVTRLKNHEQWCAPDMRDLPEEQQIAEVKKKRGNTRTTWEGNLVISTATRIGSGTQCPACGRR